MAVGDKVFRVDPATHLCTGFVELTRGAILLPPEKFMERRFEDVMPVKVAESIAYAAHAAARTRAPHIFACCFFGVWHRVGVQVLCGSIFLNASIRRAIVMVLTTVLHFS